MDVDANFVTHYRGESVSAAVQRIFDKYDELVKHVNFPGWENIKNPAVCGGAVRSWVLGEMPWDYDCYFLAEEDRKVFQQQVTTERKDDGVYRMEWYGAQNRFARNFDFINFTYSEIERVLNTYDMTIVMAGVDKERFVCHKDFFSDLASKTIKLHHLNSPVNALIRIQKYIQRGYEADPMQMYYLAEHLYMQQEDPKVPNMTKDENGRWIGNYLRFKKPTIPALDQDDIPF